VLIVAVQVDLWLGKGSLPYVLELEARAQLNSSSPPTKGGRTRAQCAHLGPR
jgi:hypothetical protein